MSSLFKRWIETVRCFFNETPVGKEGLCQEWLNNKSSL